MGVWSRLLVVISCSRCRDKSSSLRIRESSQTQSPAWTQLFQRICRSKSLRLHSSAYHYSLRQGWTCSGKSSTMWSSLPKAHNLWRLGLLERFWSCCGHYLAPRLHPSLYGPAWSLGAFIWLFTTTTGYNSYPYRFKAGLWPVGD